MRVELRLLSGRTAFADCVDDVASLRSKISDLEGIPPCLLRLTSDGRELHEESSTTLVRGKSVAVQLRLEGGKGGFGAMLRTAGARGVKTTNFDACRDLNGRRLRHVNAEAQLREWDAQAEERRLKKQQQDALNAKPSGPPPIARFDDDEYEEMLEGTRSRVSDALAAGLASASDSAFEGGGTSEAAALSTAVAARATATADAAATTTVATTTDTQGDLSSKASGKRKATDGSAAAPKAAKLSAAFDPLAALGGGDDDDSDSDGASEGACADA